MGIKLASINVDSIVGFNRRNELTHILNSNHIDICLLQETKVDDKIKIKFAGYNLLRNDIARGRSGTAILVRDSLNIRKHTIYNESLHSNSVDIFINNNWQRFTSAYFPPGLNINYDIFKRFFSNHIGSLIGGDFNARHHTFGDNSDNIYGKRIINSINSVGGTIINPPSPTHFSDRHGSTNSLIYPIIHYVLISNCFHPSPITMSSPYP